MFSARATVGLVLSWSDFCRGFGVGWYCLVHNGIDFVRVNVCLTFEFDAVWSITFSTELKMLWIKLRWTLWIGTVILSSWRLWWYCVDFEFWNTLLEFGCFTNLIVVPTVLFFFWDFFWRSGLWEYWIRSYVRGHCFGCSLCWTYTASWLHLSFRGHWPYRFRHANRGFPGPMRDHLQPIPDAEHLPFYRW